MLSESHGSVCKCVCERQKAKEMQASHHRSNHWSASKGGGGGEGWGWEDMVREVGGSRISLISKWSETGGARTVGVEVDGVCVLLRWLVWEEGKVGLCGSICNCPFCVWMGDGGGDGGPEVMRGNLLAEEGVWRQRKNIGEEVEEVCRLCWTFRGGPSSSYYMFRLDKETRPWGRRARMKRCLLVEAGNYTHFFCFHKVNSLDQQLTVPQVTHN